MPDCSQVPADFDNCVACYKKSREKALKDFTTSLRRGSRWVMFVLLINIGGVIFTLFDYEIIKFFLRHSTDYLSISAIKFVVQNRIVDSVDAGISALTMALSVVFFSASHDARECIRENQKSGSNIQPTRSLPSVPIVMNFCSRALIRMRIDPSVIYLSIFIRRGVLPSVEEIADNNVIFMPLGFITLLKQDPQTAEAIIAHEFAHIVHDDVRLWKNADYITETFLPWCSAAFFSFITIGGLAVFQRLRLDTISVFITFIVLGVEALNIIRLRFQSEHLADLAAARTTSCDAMSTAIKSFVIDLPGNKTRVTAASVFYGFGDVSVHPTVESRVECIKHFQNGRVEITTPLYSQSFRKSGKKAGMLGMILLLAFFFGMTAFHVF